MKTRGEAIIFPPRPVPALSFLDGIRISPEDLAASVRPFGNAKQLAAYLASESDADES